MALVRPDEDARLRGQALAGGDAYHLWREVLRHLALQVSLDEHEASTLGSLLPELPRLLERAIAAPQTLEPTGARLRLFHVIGDLLARLPDTTLLLLEDLQWADAESLALLSHLQSDLERRPHLLVATRHEDDGSQTPLQLLTLQRLRLPRLLRPEMEALCLSMLGEAAKNRELLDLVAAESEGNVYFIVEVMRALAAESGSLADIGSGGLPRRLMAGGITQVLGRRLARAPASARPLLELAAVAGRELDLRLLSQRLPDTAAQLAALADVGLIELYLQRWRFSHDKLREQVCDSLSPEEQIRLHRDIAAALEAVYPDDTGQAAQIARHSQQAHDLQKAARYYRIAGGFLASPTGASVARRGWRRSCDGASPTPSGCACRKSTPALSSGWVSSPRVARVHPSCPKARSPTCKPPSASMKGREPLAWSHAFTALSARRSSDGAREGKD